MTIKTKGWLGLGALLGLFSPAVSAQLSHNMSIGNPVSLAMGNAATAYIEGPDAIHFNPAALALVNEKHEQYKLQMAFFRYEGSVSGRAPGESYDPFDNPDFRQDPLLQGQKSRPIEVESPSVFLPFFGHVNLPFFAAPGYGFALRTPRGNAVFANSAFAVQVFGYERDEDNIAAFNGQRFGITRIAYFNPSIGVALGENLYVGGTVGFSWQGLGFTSKIRSALNTIAQIDNLLDSLPGINDVLELNLNPYNHVGTLEAEVEDPLSVTFTLGLLWQPEPWLSLGFAYQSEGRAQMKGEFSIEYTDSFNRLMNTLKPAGGLLTLLDGAAISGERRQSGDVTVNYTQPQWASVGASVLLTPRLRVNLDVKWVDYSVVEELRFEYDRNLDYLVLSSVVNYLSPQVGGDYADPDELRLPRGYRAVVDWSMGVEYAWNDRLKLRAGYEPRSSSIPNDRQDLLIPIGAADLYTLGFGYKLWENSRMDMGFGYLITRLDIAPGESRIANSTIEGDVVYNPFRGLRIEHQLESFILAMTYSTAF